MAYAIVATAVAHAELPVGVPKTTAALAIYDLDLHLGYRVAPHIYFGTFATANNARDYYSQSAGFTLKFMIDRVPTRTDLRVNSIPDWEGQQPFAVQ